MSYQSFYLCHYGKPGMKWGYNDGKRNGKDVARGLMIVPGSTRNLQGIASRGINTYTRAKKQSRILRNTMGTRHRLQTGLSSRDVAARGTTGVPATTKAKRMVSEKRDQLKDVMRKKFPKTKKNTGIVSKVKKVKDRYDKEAQQRRAKKAIEGFISDSENERKKKNTKKISNRVSVEFGEAQLGSGKQQKTRKKTYDNSFSSKARKVKDRIDKKITESQRGRTSWEVGEAQLGSGKQQKTRKKKKR